MNGYMIIIIEGFDRAIIKRHYVFFCDGQRRPVSTNNLTPKEFLNLFSFHYKQRFCFFTHSEVVHEHNYVPCFVHEMVNNPKKSVPQMAKGHELSIMDKYELDYRITFSCS